MANLKGMKPGLPPGPSKTGVRKACSRTWFTCTNGLLAFSGGLLFFVSVFNAAKTGDIFGELGSAGIKGTIVAGAFLVLTSVLGCVAIAKQSKPLIGLYLLISLVMTLLVLSAGFLLTFFVNDLNNVEGDEDAASFSDRVESQINDFIVAVFNSCCSVFPNVEKLKACSDPENENAAACFVFVEQYEDALERVIKFDLCTVFEELEVDINGVVQPIVGDPNITQGGCAGGDGALFKAEFTQLMEDQINGIGGLSLTFGFILLANFFATIVLLYQNKDFYFDDDDYSDYPPANTIAYGGTRAPATGQYGMNPFPTAQTNPFRAPTLGPPQSYQNQPFPSQPSYGYPTQPYGSQPFPSTQYRPQTPPYPPSEIRNGLQFPPPGSAQSTHYQGSRFNY